jgi:hypothetical protein
VGKDKNTKVDGELAIGYNSETGEKTDHASLYCGHPDR